LFSIPLKGSHERKKNTNKVYPKDLGLKSSRLIQDVVDDFKFQPSLQVISFQQTN
jgi:hypothetical protein